MRVRSGFGLGGWLVKLLEDFGFDPHLVQCEPIAWARLKNDKVDPAIVAQLLRAGLLPEAWIAAPDERQMRGGAAQPDPRGFWSATASTGRATAGAGRAWSGSPGWRFPPVAS
jgi:hypothetical protein